MSRVRTDVPWTSFFYRFAQRTLPVPNRANLRVGRFFPARVKFRAMVAIHGIAGPSPTNSQSGYAGRMDEPASRTTSRTRCTMPANSLIGRTLTVLRIVCLSIPVLSVFWGTVLACALIVSWWQGSGFLTPATLLPSTVCGLIVWLFVGSFHLKKEQVSWLVGDPSMFRLRVRKELLDQGYDTAKFSGNTILFRPGFTSYLFGGWITVTVDHGVARIVGPKERLEHLVRRLRLSSFVANDQKALTSSVIRQGKHLLKRVQISCRVSREQLPGLQQAVLQGLAREGAEVFCDVSILAQSELGIPASVVEGPIRDWLTDQNLKPIIQKEYLHGSGERRVAIDENRAAHYVEHAIPEIVLEEESTTRLEHVPM